MCHSLSARTRVWPHLFVTEWNLVVSIFGWYPTNCNDDPILNTHVGEQSFLSICVWFHEFSFGKLPSMKSIFLIQKKIMKSLVGNNLNATSWKILQQCGFENKNSLHSLFAFCGLDFIGIFKFNFYIIHITYLF